MPLLPAIVLAGIAVTRCAFGAGVDTAPTEPSPPVRINALVPDLHFTDIRALRRSLSDVGECRAYVLTFTTVDCPLVRRYMPRLGDLAKQYREHNVAFLAVNVGAGDTIRAMAAQAVDLDSPLMFVKDVELMVARAVGATRTPEVVVLDAERALRYRGRIDDQFRIGGARPNASRNDLELAIDDILAGRPVAVAETLVDGCIITPPSHPELPAGVTWSSMIAGMVHSRCSGCHQPGVAAPFSLRSYEDVTEHADMIAEVVENETMPPWYAFSEHGHFQNDCSLTKRERSTLLAWIRQGCPEGDPNAAPEPPAPPSSGWRIGQPDLVLTMLGEHIVPATGFVPYHYALLPFLSLRETWVEAFEIRPMNPAVVHHCNMAYLTAKGAGEETFITGYVPGGQPMDFGRFDGNAAFRIPAGAGLGLQIHYATTGREERSRIQVGLRFPREPIRKEVRHFLLDPRRWTIPPHDPAFRVSASRTFDRDVSLLGMFTHMHVRGRDMTFYADVPGAGRETLLMIPNFNFEWQLGYEFAEGSRSLPAGTRIEAVAHFDNSAFNPYNPDPRVPVRYGPQTVDEMCNGFVFFVDSSESLDVNVDPRTGWRRQ